MCNITKVLQVICFSLTVLHVVESSLFKTSNTGIRRQASGSGKDTKCRQSSDFRCKSGECIKEEDECNGIVDCQDASDETNACRRIKCPPYLFRCKYGACINANFECNGQTDCRDNSDETSLKCSDMFLIVQCEDNQFRCNSGECIEEDFKCDGKKDCKDGSDETAAVCYAMTCPGFTYRCKYGACVDGYAECDGKVQCFDASDEDPDKCKTDVTIALPIPAPTTITPTPGPGPSLEESACTLPDYTIFGKWTVVGSNFGYSSGMSVVAGTVLQLTCQHGYKLDGDALILCQKGQWSTAIGRCLKTCPPLHSTSTTKVTCIGKNQGTVNCSDVIDGTLAKFQCAHFYEDLALSNKPVLLCRDGSWDQRKPECTPVCGRKSVSATPLIINGTTVKKGEYPWQVALYKISSKLLICGGSLINQRLVITAAHCITDEKGIMDSKENYEVAVGKYYRPYNDSRDTNEAQFSKIYEMFIPEEYGGSALNFMSDIAVIVTMKTFIVSERVQPVCVDWGSIYASELSSPSGNKFGYVAGWGYTRENADPSEELKELKVPAITFETCRKHLSDFEIYVTSDKLCAGYTNEGTSVCRGDSGGGLVFKHQNRYYLTGIVSVSPISPTSVGGCSREQYGLYTNVYKYLDSFILRKESKYRPSL